MKNIAQAIRDDPRLSKLTAALETANLMAELEKTGPFTLFAPSNDAISKVLGSLPTDEAEFKKLLLRHVVPGKRITDENFSERKEDLDTMNADDKVTIWKLGGIKRIGFKDDIVAFVYDNENDDMDASNGVIYIISDVLMTAKATTDPGEFTTFKILIRLVPQ